MGVFLGGEGGLVGWGGSCEIWVVSGVCWGGCGGEGGFEGLDVKTEGGDGAVSVVNTGLTGLAEWS